MAIDNNPGGLGGLGGFLSDNGGAFADMLQALGHSLMTATDRRTPFANFSQGMQLVEQQNAKAQERQAIEMLLTQSGFAPDEAKRLARNPAIAKMAIDQKKDRESTEFFERGWRELNGEGSAPSAPRQPAAVSPAPARPAPLSAYNQPAAGGEGRPSMIGQPMPTLASSGVSAGIEPILQLARADSGDNYNALTYKRGPNGPVPGGEAPLENMTVAEVMDFQRRMPSMGHASGAVGAYQMIPGTLARAVERAGIDPSTTKFDRPTQDRLAAELIKMRGFDAYASGEMSPEQFGKNLSQEWAILKGPSGRGAYDGFNMNRASVPWERVKEAISGSGQTAPQERVQVASLSGAPSGASSRMLDPTSIQLDGLPPGPVPSNSVRNLPRNSAGDLDTEAPGPGTVTAAPANGGAVFREQDVPRLAQVAQASGAMPGGQPPLRNVVPPTMMPSLNAFSPDGASEWRGQTAQATETQRITASDPLPRMTTEEANPAAGLARTREEALAQGRKYAYYIAHPKAPAGLKELSKLKYQQIMEDSKLTNDQKEYLQEVSQGFKGTFGDYKRSLQSGPNSITEYEYYVRQEKQAGRQPKSFDEWDINRKRAQNKTETSDDKFADKMNAKAAERWEGYISSADAAKDKLSDLTVMRETSRRLGSQGAWAGAKQVLGPYAEAFSINIDGLSDIQLYESITKRLAPQMRPPGSGSTSDVEYKGFVAAIGPLSNNPMAREAILDTFEAAARNEVTRGEIASRLSVGEITRVEAERELRALPDPFTSFKNWRKENPDAYLDALKASRNANSTSPRETTKPAQSAPIPAGRFRWNPQTNSMEPM